MLRLSQAGRRRLAVAAALAALYLIWGSTYLAMRFAIEGFPPFMMAGTRFLLAGGTLYVFLRLRGAAAPGRGEWAGSVMVGGFLLLGGNGGVAYAEQWVASGAAALAVATVPLWTVLFAGWRERHWPDRQEWAGIALGFAGVALLSLGANMQASAAGAAVLLFSTLSWAFGSVWSRGLSLPPGLMGSAAQMLGGGALLMAASLVLGEHMTAVPPVKAVLAWGYLVVFGSFVAFSSYLYLLQTVRPAVATSYAYVNPVIAVVLGAALGGERFTPVEGAAMAVILAAVGLVMVKRPGRRA
jgi:drug/metabolite transporter (DMT)-like permease